MKKLYLLLILFLLFIVGCSNDTPKTEGGEIVKTPNKDEPIEYKIKAPNFDTPKRTDKLDFKFDDLFNLGNTVNINIYISDSELNLLQSDYETGFKSDIYRRADKVVISITNHGKTYNWEYENVGIRQKGNTSRRSIYDENYNLNLNHYKLSFDETFTNSTMYDKTYISKYGNLAYKTREFLGLEGLDFRWNKNIDSTNIREIYSSYLYKASGLIVQSIGLSNVCFNELDKANKQTSFGLCTIFEPANKGMIKRNLTDENITDMPNFTQEQQGKFGVEGKTYGDLYKCSYGIGEGYANGADLSLDSISGKKVGVSNVSGSYIPAYDRKTNNEEIYDDGLLKQMIKTVNNGIYEDIAKVVNLNYLAKEEAVSYIIGNPDAMRYNYNNYMIYHSRKDGKAIIIPIDNDRCFGILKDWNVRNGLKEEEIFGNDSSNDKQRNNLLNKTILSKNDNECKTMYYDFIMSIAKSDWVKDETFNKYYEIAKKSYPNDYFSLTDKTHNLTFSEYMSAKLAVILMSDKSDTDDDSNTNKTYNNLYVVGTFNNWGSYNENELSSYKLTHKGDGLYEVTVKINQVETENNRNYIKFKFNNGYNNYNEIDWTVSEDLKTLIKEVGKSCFIYDVNVGNYITFSINVNTKEVNISIR